jgi:hypothetical protein
LRIILFSPERLASVTKLSPRGLRRLLDENVVSSIWLLLPFYNGDWKSIYQVNDMIDP